MFEILKQYCEVAAPGGQERRVHKLIEENWRPYVQEGKITPVGNYVAHVGGQGPKLMLVGHGDEIGFAVKYISPEGFIFFNSGQRNPNGKPDLRGSYFTPLGQQALIIGRDNVLSGVFATQTGHILTPQQRQKTELDWNDMFIDVFLPSREAVEEAGIKVGDRIVWDVPTRQHGKYYSGKAMDNRVSLALMEALLQRLEPEKLAFDLYLGSTIQEESGLYGAQSINREVQCTYAIALDTGLSGDIPGVDPRDVSTVLGKGPILIQKDLYSYDVLLGHHIEDAAAAANIPLQYASYTVYGTDSGALLREGVAAAAITVASRYTHSPFETVHADDLDATVDLLLEVLYRPMEAE
ncbi:M42 family peptidase [Phototrophicus methaneseepsis]|uniref:M42 family peptidase n=1 Tax=Phototrophicus methaneseepsis TaxID=2710758 RepID=A0A7S8EA98_9CHLR|nr:M42 family peptidase [Phototrophicus methaneseepsis]QPC83272.1 M42 family peptidase [Phototrophicus methaneseepsis]